jgi:preprotein translocase subunit SecD
LASTAIPTVSTIPAIPGKVNVACNKESTETHNLALLLRAGSLSAPVEIIEERTIGPSLGADNVEKGVLSVIAGFVLVLIFMAMRYRVFGMVANVALMLNLVMIVSVLSLLQATLTLPGIAGIVLTVGSSIISTGAEREPALSNNAKLCASRALSMPVIRNRVENAPWMVAVDANVLIFERIKEELGTNGDIQKAISSGYDKAVLTIADANITTLP